MEDARKHLGGLFQAIDESGDKTYTSSKCVIKSIFNHPLDEVCKMKSQRLGEAKEEVCDNIKALLEPKKLVFNQVVRRENLTQIEQDHLYDKVDN